MMVFSSGREVTLHQHSGCRVQERSIHPAFLPSTKGGRLCVREFFKHRKGVQMRESQNISTNYATLSVAPILQSIQKQTERLISDFSIITELISGGAGTGYNCHQHRAVLLWARHYKHIV